MQKEGDSLFGEDDYSSIGNISEIEGKEEYESDVTTVEDKTVDEFNLEGTTQNELEQSSTIRLTGPMCVISLSEKSYSGSGVIEMVEFQMVREKEPKRCVKFTMKEFNLLQKLMNSFSNIKNS